MFSNERTIVYLPVLLILLEIGKILSIQYSFEYGYNGFIYVYILIIYSLSFKIIRFKKSSLVISLSFVLLTIYYISRADWDISFFNMLSRVGSTIIVLYSYFVGYFTYKNMNSIYAVNKKLTIATGILIIFIIVCTILEFGETAYSGGIVYGINHFQYYYLALYLVLVPFLFHPKNIKLYEDKKYYLIIITVLSIIIVSISLMRTAWIISIIGYLSYLLFFRKTKTSLVNMVMGILIILFMIAIVIETDLYKIRESRFSNEYSIDNEGRYIEYYLVHDSINNSNIDLLFGTGKLYNAVGNYGFGERPLHSTYSNIIFGSGYIGLFLFLLFMMLIFIKAKVLKRQLSSNNDYSRYLIVGIFTSL